MPAFKTFLVAGSAGFIGSNFTRYLLYHYRNARIVGMDRLDASLFNIYVNRFNTLHITDVSNPYTTEKIFKVYRPDFVIDLAGNHDGLCNMMSCSHEYVNKFIFVSGNCAGSSCNEEMVPEDESEQLVVSKGGLVLRCPEVFGPRQRKGFIANTYASISRKEKIIIGKHVRDLLYVDDLSSTIARLCMENLSPVHDIYNISAGNDFTDPELSMMIADTAGAGHKLEFLASNETPEDGSMRRDLDSSRFRNEFGWKPERSIKETLAYTVRWFQNNPWHFKQEQ